MDSPETGAKKGFAAEIHEDIDAVIRASVGDIRAYGRWNLAIFAFFVLLFFIPVKIEFSEVCVPVSELWAAYPASAWQWLKLVPGVLIPAAVMTVASQMITATIYENLNRKREILMIEIVIIWAMITLSIAITKLM